MTTSLPDIINRCQRLAERFTLRDSLIAKPDIARTQLGESADASAGS